jgi:hypothetical protein
LKNIGKKNQSVYELLKRTKVLVERWRWNGRLTVVKDTDRVRAQLRIPLVGHVAPNVDQVHVLEIFLKKVPEK